MSPPTITLTWRCDQCSSPIEIGEGCVAVDQRAAWQAMDAFDNFEREQAASEFPEMLTGYDLQRLLELPDGANWQAVHFICEPDIEMGDWYVIEIHRIDTVAKLLRWNAHLHEKNWIEHTDWDDMLCARFAPKSSGV